VLDALETMAHAYVWLSTFFFLHSSYSIKRGLVFTFFFLSKWNLRNMWTLALVSF
jgi:hypothetical protein